MCDPTAIALGSFVLKAGGEVLNARAQNETARVNAAEARASETRQINDINLRQTQEQQAASQQLEAAARQTTTAVSSARVSAGEAGVTGASVDALLNTIGAEGSRAAQDITLNESNTLSQLERQKAGVSAEAQSRINSVQKSNPFAVALRIAGAGVNLATQLQSRQAPGMGGTVAPNVGPNTQSRIKTTPYGFIPPTFRIRAHG